MATSWKEWENKIGRIFKNIGYTKVDNIDNSINLQPREFCLEKLNHDMQVDVFVCVDKSQWVHIECRDRRNRTINGWLHEIKGRTSQRLTKLKKGLKIKNIKVFGVAATSLRDLDGKTQNVADDTGVALWHHGVVDYLLAITKGAGGQAEELVLNRCGIRRSKYLPINIQVQPWPGISESWFIGYVSPLQIAHATFVYQRGNGFGESAYQRFLKPQRITEIADFVRSGKSFPNSIVMALPKGTKLPGSTVIRANNLITISIPGDPEGIKIIDGQHRFFGALASGMNPKLLCTFVQSEDLDQAIMFAKINGKQVSVSKSQLISLFSIPNFAAKIAAGYSERDHLKIEREDTVYRALQRMNQKGLFAHKFNFISGRPSKDTIPFKFIFDTLMSLWNVEPSGLVTLSGTTQEKGKVLGDRLTSFLSAWGKVLGKERLMDSQIWLQPTMLSALIKTYPDCRWNAGKKDVDSWLKRRGKISWIPKPESYRGGSGASTLSKLLCRKIGIKSQYI
ncbi:MAG: DGQHR domain-containing protein [Patescibacteria group bacterium]|nr:DGQHR domain-containing protein [Patescibacteria group bacterium]